MLGIPFSRLLKEFHDTLLSPLDPQTCEDRLRSVRLVFREGVYLEDLVLDGRDEEGEEVEVAPTEMESQARRSEWFGQTIQGHARRGVLELSMRAPPGQDRLTLLSATFERADQGTLIRCRTYADDSEFEGLRVVVILTIVAAALMAFVAFGPDAKVIWGAAGLLASLLVISAYSAVAMLFSRDRYSYHHHQTLVRYVAQITKARLISEPTVADTP